MKDIHILHLSCKYKLGGWVTLGERAFEQILTLSDYPSWYIAEWIAIDSDSDFYTFSHNSDFTHNFHNLFKITI